MPKRDLVCGIIEKPALFVLLALHVVNAPVLKTDIQSLILVAFGRRYHQDVISSRLHALLSAGLARTQDKAFSITDKGHEFVGKITDACPAVFNYTRELESALERLAEKLKLKRVFGVNKNEE